MPSLDERLLTLARTRWHRPAAERLVAGFSRLGEHAAVWLALGAGGIVFSRAHRGEFRRGLATVTMAYGLNTALKLIVRRPRPQLAGLPALTSTPTQLSFPSAHASTSFAGALAYSRAGLPRGPLLGLAGGLALSRLYLGVHHPSDVLAGAVLGSGLALARGSR